MGASLRESPGRYAGKPYLPEAHGLSLFADADDMEIARDFVPLMARKPVAAVEIDAGDGVLRSTPMADQRYGKSHHDWWTNPYDLIPEAIVVVARREVD